MIVAIFAAVGGLLVLAFLANRLFRITRVPDVVVLMLVGVLLGPVFGIIDGTRFRTITSGIGTLAIVLVLFEAGLELDLRDTIRHFPGSLLLSLFSFSSSVAAVSFLGFHLLGLPLLPALLVGAVLGCTSSTIVLPVLQQVEARAPVRIALSLESALGDVFAVLAVGVLLNLDVSNGSLFHNIARTLLGQIAVAVLLGLLDGLIWSRLLPILSEQRFWHALTLANVLLLYAGSEYLHAGSLIAVLSFGLTLANFPGIVARLDESSVQGEHSGEHHRHVLTFHSELGFLVRTFFFVLLGAVAEIGGLKRDFTFSLLAILALFAARCGAVLLSGWAIRNLQRGERELLLWMMPRGLITAVLAFQVVEARGTEFSFLPAFAFAVILATNLMLVIGSVRAKHPSPQPQIRKTAT
jgi:cell volume regulation protein A